MKWIRHTLLMTVLVALLTAGSLSVAEATPPPGAASTSAQVSTRTTVLLGPGDRGRRVRVVQARLQQLEWFVGRLNGFYGSRTTAAVRRFQRDRAIEVSGRVDRRTMGRLTRMTQRPTRAELANRAHATSPRVRLDRRCTTGRALCIDKASRTLRWVVAGRVRMTLAARFGGPATPTREGQFRVFRKSRDHVSNLFGSPMPFAMFFSGGQAVHFSPDFAAVGYAGASHGCVNIRNYRAIRSLFDRVHLGDKVVVYRG